MPGPGSPPHNDEIIYSFASNIWLVHSGITVLLVIVGSLVGFGFWMIFNDGDIFVVFPFLIAGLIGVVVCRIWRRARGPYDQITGVITSKQMKGPKDAWDETNEEWFIRLNRNTFGVDRHVFDLLSKGDRITVSYISGSGFNVGAIVRHRRSSISE